MASAWQTVRVFISSTFRDMHAERDWLVKRVFPALRAELEPYRVHLVDIDLRWGVTEGQAESGGALDVCLDQIDECRPFFLGLLGERYGYVPEDTPEHVTNKYGWIQHTTKKSITELEMLYGVLRDVEMYPDSLFCFRNPAVADPIPEPLRSDFCSEDDGLAKKLNELKQAIRDAGLPVPPLENYSPRYTGVRFNWRLAQMELNTEERQALQGVASDGFIEAEKYKQLDDHQCELVNRFGTVDLQGLEGFGKHIHQWLLHSIRTRFELPDQPPSAKLAETDPLAEERDYHERFIESRLRVFIGREEVQQQLMDYVTSDSIESCLVTAPSGSGKSATLAKIARSLQSQVDNQQSNVVLIPHFVGASPTSTSQRQMLRRFCLLMKDEFGFDDEVPQDVSELAQRFRDFLARVPEDCRAVLIIDALNQLDETDNAQSLYWLPWELPPHVKIITSCISDADREEPVLQAFALRPHRLLDLPSLTDVERRDIIRAVPSLSAKTLDDNQVNLLLANPATRNPLYLLVALEELRGFGSYEQLNHKIGSFPQEGDTLTTLYRQVIERLVEEFDCEVVKNVLTLLASARRGLSERELLDLVEGADVRIHDSQSDLFPVLRQLRVYLQPRGELLDFFHRNLFKAVGEHYLETDQEEMVARLLLAEYFHAQPFWLAQPQGSRDSRRLSNKRKVDELPWLRVQSQRWDAVEELFMDLDFLEAKNEAGMVFELTRDFSDMVAALPVDRLKRRIFKLLNEALRREIHFVARHAEDYPQALFQSLWNIGWWYDCPQAAQHYMETQREQGPTGLPVSPRENGLSTHPAAKSRLETGSGLHKLLEHWRERKQQTMPGFIWLRSLRPPPMHLGTPQLAVLRGHEDTVMSISISPDSCRIVSVSNDKTVRLWDAASGVELYCLHGHEAAVESVSFSPDGQRIVTGASDKTVRVWDTDSGVEMRCLRGHQQNVTSVCFSPDGVRIASASWDDTVRVWDADNGVEICCLRGHENGVYSVSYSPDGQRIVTGSGDKTVRVWDADNGAELCCLRGHGFLVRSVEFSPDNRRIVSGSFDRSARIWDAESGAVLRCLNRHNAGVWSASFSPDGQRVVTGGSDKVVCVWDADSGAELRCLDGHEADVHSVLFSPDGHWIVTGGTDKSVRLWDANSEVMLRGLRGHEDTVTSISYSPDGHRIVSGSKIDRRTYDTVRVWDADNGSEIHSLFGEDVSIVSYSPDGKRIVAGAWDGVVNLLRIWDANSGEELHRMRGHEQDVTSVSYSPDSRRIVSSSRSKDGTINAVRVWDADCGAELFCLGEHEAAVWSVIYSPDGQWIVTCGNDKTVRVWDADRGSELRCLRGHEAAVYSVSFSPDGRRLVTGSGDKTVRVWDFESGTELRCLLGHEGRVGNVSYSPDSRRIVSDAEDNTVRIWDPDSGDCIESIEGFGDVAGIATSAGPIASSKRRTWRAINRGEEIVVEHAVTKRQVGWLPNVTLVSITTSPSGRQWAGAERDSDYFCIFRLEGGDTEVTHS